MSAVSTAAPARLLGAFRGPTPEARFRRWLLFATLGGLALRIAYIYVGKRWDHVAGDGIYYHGAARLLADGEGFIHPWALLTGRTLEAADHPPLFTLWLAVPFFLGITGMTALLVWSCFLGSATVAVVGLVGRKVGGDRVGIIAAVLAAVYPPIWSQDGTLQSETMAILLVSVVVLAAYRYWERPTVGRAAVLGLLVGLAALSRSELLLLAPLVVLPLALWARSLPMALRLRQLAAAALACVVALAPWCIYNLTRFENTVLLSTGAEITLLTSNCDSTYYGDTIGYWSIDCGREIEITPDMDQSEAAVLYRRAALDYIEDHKGRVPLVVAARWARVANLWDPATQVRLERTIEQRPAFVAWSSIISFWAVALLAVAGAVLLRRRRVPVLPLVAPVLVVLWAVTVTHAESRYRASCEPALVVLAAVALQEGYRRWRARGEVTSVQTQAPTEAAAPGVPVGAP